MLPPDSALTNEMAIHNYLFDQEADDLRTQTIELVKNVGAVQRRLLEDLLEKDSGCEYLRMYSVDGKLDVQTFKERVPLVQYADIEHYVQRIAQEDCARDVLTCQRISHFHRSSGTSGGKFKILPVSERAVHKNALVFSKLTHAFFQLTQVYQNLPSDGICMGFYFHGSLHRTPSGHDLADVSTLYMRGESFACKCRPHRFAAPLDVVICQDLEQNLYCQFLCGLLKSSRVVMIYSVLIKAVKGAMGFFRDHWRELCRDIETGSLSDRITDTAVRDSVSKILNGPNPELADLVRQECSKESWDGILTRLWPNLSVIYSICTGALLQDVEIFEFLTQNKVKIMSPAFGCSEGFVAFNPHLEDHPKNVTYVFHPEAGFFEFRRLRDSTLVELADMMAGDDEYEIVFTNLSGLWRYRLGDIVKCVGHYYSSPRFQVVGRDNLLVNVGQEVVYEYEMAQAVEAAARLHISSHASLVDYTTTVDRRDMVGHYVIFVELESHNKFKYGESDGDLNTFAFMEKSLEDCCLTIENCLNDMYRSERRRGVIAPLELILVKRGTFDLLYADGQVGKNQLKQPRTYKPDHPSIQKLNDAFLKKIRSPALASKFLFREED